jgi:hypothetical protein
VLDVGCVWIPPEVRKKTLAVCKDSLKTGWLLNRIFIIWRANNTAKEVCHASGSEFKKHHRREQ